jgi:hypothetical protein
MRRIPEPDREEWITRLRERARQDAEELLPRPGFGVYGLLAPDLGPGALMESARVNGVWEQIGLAYGDPLAVSGPLISVTTVSRSQGQRDLGVRRDPGSERELWLLLDQARSRIADHAGVDVEEPAGPPDFAGMDLLVDGRAVSCVICTHGRERAARLTVAELTVAEVTVAEVTGAEVTGAEVTGAEVTVVVVGRDVDPGSVRLASVHDLAPYLRARGERIGRLAERLRQRPEPVLPPAEGAAAYRALIDQVLAAEEQRLEAERAGRAPRHKADEGAVRHALWQRAVREQARLSGCDKWQADETVTLVVNHLGHLAEQAAWFRADPALREAAIDETLQYTLGEDVPSARAQQNWAGYRARQMASPGEKSAERLRAELETRSALMSRWLEAWSAWTQRG